MSLLPEWDPTGMQIFLPPPFPESEWATGMDGKIALASQYCNSVLHHLTVEQRCDYVEQVFGTTDPNYLTPDRVEASVKTLIGNSQPVTPRKLSRMIAVWHVLALAVENETIKTPKKVRGVLEELASDLVVVCTLTVSHCFATQAKGNAESDYPREQPNKGDKRVRGKRKQ